MDGEVGSLGFGGDGSAGGDFKRACLAAGDRAGVVGLVGRASVGPGLGAGVTKLVSAGVEGERSLAPFFLGDLSPCFLPLLRRPGGEPPGAWVP